MKIDISTIEGYDSMSDADKIKALESYSFEVDSSKYVSKATFDRTASELASTKKALTEKLSAEEKKALDEAQKAEALKAQFEEATRKLAIMENKSKLLELGYDAALATETAEAIADGDTEKVFLNQQKYREALIAQTKAEILKNAPAPTGGGGAKTMTKEEFRKLSAAERADIAAKQPELYNEIYKE